MKAYLDFDTIMHVDWIPLEGASMEEFIEAMERLNEMSWSDRTVPTVPTLEAGNHAILNQHTGEGIVCHTIDDELWPAEGFGNGVFEIYYTDLKMKKECYNTLNEMLDAFEWYRSRSVKSSRRR